MNPTNLNPNPEPNLNVVNYSSNFNLEFCSQNVRSFNISTRNDITVQKVLAITSLKCDIFFLSDLRLNSVKQKSAVNDLEKQFFFRGYKFLHNSVAPSRGVGILINNKLFDSGFSVISQYGSDDCNLLLLKCIYKNKPLAIAAIYGPNLDTDIAFYNTLSAALGDVNSPVILAGDWNATLDTSEVGTNLDVVNMRNIPSIRRSERILQLCQDFSLLDPFRVLNPEKTEYTFIPSGINDRNRSRLDFFLISHTLLTNGTKCKVPHGLISTFFDHKNVT